MTDIEEALEIIWDRCQHCKDVQEALDILRGERPHGEWIYHKYDKDFECSMCHYRFDEDEFGLEIPQENGTWVKVCVYNFCPNCGSENRPKDRPKEGEAE